MASINNPPPPHPIDALDSNNENVLQKHVAFFDTNHDGIVYPWDTFKGFRAIGSGLLLSAMGAIVINVALSYKTRPGQCVSLKTLLFPIEVKNIHRAKHGSDTGVYDTQGRFVPLKFEEIFKKHAHKHRDALTSDELMEMLKSNRQPKNYAGWIASWAEWKILYTLCKDKNGLLQKDTVKSLYDGTLFDKMNKKQKSPENKKA